MTGLLRSVFGFPEFRPGQGEAIGCLMSGEHALVVMPTGAGKSLIYQFAAVAKPGTALVISPLISLMQDQVASLVRRRIPATFINSSTPAEEQLRRMDAMAEGQYRLVYVAPERLRSTPFRRALTKARISLLAIDEAHCISQWGHDFRPDYLQIAETRRAMGNPLTAALTATATPRVMADIASMLGLDPVRHVVTGFNRPNLSFEVSYARDAQGKMRSLLAMLGKLGGGAGIVYAGTRRDAEELAEFITTTAGIRARFYHAGMGSEERTAVQDDFMSGKMQVVVATNAFGMGIDRSDVRLVAHYSIPGSLEQYYQEAGRGGRDGQPARAVLLYSPPDRALHEFFIESSEFGIGDLKELHVWLASEARQPRWLTLDDISIDSGMHEVAVRVAMSQLEAAEAVTIPAVEGPRMFVQVNPWSAGAVSEVVRRSKAHLGNRRQQLEQIVRYAETNECRRRVILDHFGDTGDGEAPLCCDNCMVQRGVAESAEPTDPSELTPENKTALLILDSVRRMPWEVGVGKLARVLTGSKAKEIEQLEYNKIRCYGKLSVFRHDEVTTLIEQMVSWGYLKTVGGKLPVLRLTNKGESALAMREKIGLKFPRQIVRREVDKAKKKRANAGDSVELTATLHAQGLSAVEIAEQRGLVPATIYGHFAELIANGRVALSDVLPADVVEAVRKTRAEAGGTTYLSQIKRRLPDAIGFGEIKCVLAEGNHPQSSLAARASDGGSPPCEVGAGGGDAVAEFLARSHPKEVRGPWKVGWSLGFHSSFTGAEWARSGVGDMTYRLKYQGDLSALAPLVEQAMDLIREHPELAEVDAIVPVPPTTSRPSDPVKLFVDALAAKIGKSVMSSVSRARQTRLQKEMRSMAQKRANVAGTFVASGEVRGKRVLLVDDLYDSGATLQEVAKALRGVGAVSVSVLALTRTIHSDA